MTDPLSIAGTAVGIVSLGLTATKGLVYFYTAARDQKSNTANTARKLRGLLDLLQILDYQIAGCTFRHDERDLLDNIERLIHNCDGLIRKLDAANEKFQDTSTRNISAVARTATGRLAYPFCQETLQKLEEDVDATVSHLQLALHALQQDDSRETKLLLDLVRVDIVSSAIRHWLRAPDASVEYNAAYKKRHPSTGLWLVKGSLFSSWLQTTNSFLWLNGFAGCGKSVLCSTAIQYAFRHRRASPRIAIAFFFFVFDDKSKQGASAMLRAIILQLSTQLKDTDPLARLHDSYRNTTPPDEDLAKCLRQLVRRFEHTYILLDALDESPLGKHRKEVLQHLVDLHYWAEPGLHLMVTSRDEPDIGNVLRQKLGASEISMMKNTSVDRDIAAFVSQHLRESGDFQQWEDEYDRIETIFAGRANGVCVFRYGFPKGNLLTSTITDFDGWNANSKP